MPPAMDDREFAMSLRGTIERPDQGPRPRHPTTLGVERLGLAALRAPVLSIAAFVTLSRCRRSLSARCRPRLPVPQTNGGRSVRGATCPFEVGDLCGEGAPLGQCGQAPLLVRWPSLLKPGSANSGPARPVPLRAARNPSNGSRPRSVRTSGCSGERRQDCAFPKRWPCNGATSPRMVSSSRHGKFGKSRLVPLMRPHALPCGARPDRGPRGHNVRRDRSA